MFAKYLFLDDGLGKPLGTKLKSMKQVWDALAKLDGDRFSILIVAEAPPTPESGVPQVDMGGGS